MTTGKISSPSLCD